MVGERTRWSIQPSRRVLIRVAIPLFALAVAYFIYRGPYQYFVKGYAVPAEAEAAPQKYDQLSGTR